MRSCANPSQCSGKAAVKLTKEGSPGRPTRHRCRAVAEDGRTAHLLAAPVARIDELDRLERVQGGPADLARRSQSAPASTRPPWRRRDRRRSSRCRSAGWRRCRSRCSPWRSDRVQGTCGVAADAAPARRQGRRGERDERGDEQSDVVTASKLSLKKTVRVEVRQLRCPVRRDRVRAWRAFWRRRYHHQPDARAAAITTIKTIHGHGIAQKLVDDAGHAQRRIDLVGKRDWRHFGRPLRAGMPATRHERAR